jgi:hypothetical protein
MEVFFTPSSRILHGLDEIAAYLRVSRRTAQRWTQSLALPTMQSPSGLYMTSTALIDLWILSVRNVQNGRTTTGDDVSPLDS